MSDPRQARWDIGLAALTDFVAQHGHAVVPARYSADDGFRLGQWVWVQRGLARRGRLSAERIERLSALGFAWQGRRARSERLVRAVEDYSARNGFAATTALLGRALELDDQPVASALRSARRRGHLPTDLEERLRQAGFSFDIAQARLAHGLTRLDAFRAQYPNRPVPARYRSPGGFRLGEWVRRMRRAMISEQLDPQTAELFRTLDGGSSTMPARPSTQENSEQPA